MAVSAYDVREWPAHWRHAQGIADGDLAAKGRTHTVAQFVAAAQVGHVEARLHGRWESLAGFGDVGFGRLTDDTGSVALALPLSVVAVGSGDPGLVVEVDVVASGPPPDLPDLDTSAIVAAALGGEPDAAAQMGAALAGDLGDLSGRLPQIRRMVPVA